MNSLGKTGLDHYFDYISKTFKTLIFYRNKPKQNEQHRTSRKLKHKFPTGPYGESSRFRQIPKLQFISSSPPPVNHCCFTPITLPLCQ